MNNVDAPLNMIYAPPRPATSRFKRIWLAMFAREKATDPAADPLILIVVGGRGRGSVQLQMERNAGNWTVEAGRAFNAKAISLPHAPNAKRWLILDGRGRLLYEGEFQHTVRTVEIPAGAIRAVEL